MKVTFNFIHHICKLSTFWVFKEVELQTIWHTFDATKNEERRKRKEKVNLKERRKTLVKKIWSLREERPYAMSLRNYE